MSNIVVSPHYLSTNAGIEILQNGGNAVDAAIATNIVQGVVAPETCGIGGDLFSLIWINGKNTPYCLDSSGYAGSNVDISQLSSQIVLKPRVCRMICENQKIKRIFLGLSSLLF